MRGRLTHNAPLGAQSWFRAGGAADALFWPTDADDLAAYLASRPDVPLTPLGAMANCIIRDGGVPGVVVRLGNDFCDIKQIDTATLRVGAGALNGSVAAAAAKAGIGGFAFLIGIPGTIGGALRMNAGAYGAEMADIVAEVHALDRQGRTRALTRAEMGFAYRATTAPGDWIFTGAVLRGAPRPPADIWAEMEAIKKRRLTTQPIRERTGGSTFANPSAEQCAAAGLPEGTRAWEIVARVGGRGLRVGGAQMSEQHCNFMVNTGDATAADLEALGEEIRRRALDALGLELRWEIKRLGRPQGAGS
jgi:UDP-N-acetylmuramate dehydrogenase